MTHHTRILAAACCGLFVTLSAFAADTANTPTPSPSPSASPAHSPPGLVMEDEHYNPFDERYQFIFFATLEGLYRDGVSDADVKSLLATDAPNGGYLNFIYTCPICMPVESAIVTYKLRPKIDHLKIFNYYTTERTFGSGLPPEVSLALTSKKASVRLGAVNSLVSKWIAYRMDHSSLTDDQKQNLIVSLKKGREEGMKALHGFAAGMNGPGALKAFAAGYQDGDECAICNASLQMPLKLKSP